MSHQVNRSAAAQVISNLPLSVLESIIRERDIVPSVGHTQFMLAGGRHDGSPPDARRSSWRGTGCVQIRYLATSPRKKVADAMELSEK